MSRRTTLRMGGRAVAEVRVADEAGLDRLDAALRCLGGRPMAFGRGSNVLARDGELDVTLVTVDVKRGPESVGAGATVRCGAGTPLPTLLGWTARRGLSGLEKLAGIPGRVGGAVAMNAGSFGQQVADTLHRVRLWTGDRGPFWMEREDVSMGYRSFSPRGVKGWFLVLEAEFNLTPADPEEMVAVMRETLARKRASQPVRDWSAGCVFKNPAPDAPAGKLLDEAGMRGFTLGGVAFSTIHANFLVNTGEGTATQALELIELAREKVRAHTGRELELEVKLWP